MSLTLHHFRKDLRQFRILVLAWWGLLLVDLAHNVGWIGAIETGARLPGGVPITEMLWGWLTFALFVFLFKIPQIIVLSESPAGENYLSTRPLPRSALWKAKALFMLVVLILPAVLQETLGLALQKVPAYIIVQGSLERFLFVAPFVLASAAFASIWSTGKQWMTAALTIGLGGWLVVGGVMVTLEVLNKHFLDANPNWGRYVVCLWFVAIAFGVMGAINAAKRWPMRRRLAGASAIMLCALCLIAALRNNWTSLPFQKDAEFQTVATAGRIEASYSQILIGRLESPGQPHSLTAHVTPTFKPISSNWVVEWSCPNAHLETTGGPNPQSRPLDLVKRPDRRVYGWRSQASRDDLSAIAHWLPARTTLLRDDMMSGRNGASLGSFPPSALPDPSGSAAYLSGTLDALAFRWEPIAQLSLSPGTSSRDAYGSWQVRQSGLSDDKQHYQVTLYREQLWLHVSRDPLLAESATWPADRLEFVLHIPARKLALATRYAPYPRSQRGELTAFTKYLITPSFQLRGSNEIPLSEEDLESARLLVMTKRYLGEASYPWRSPELLLRDQPQSATRQAQITRLSNAEFYQRLDRLRWPAPDAPRAEMGRFLYEVYRLVDSRVQNPSDMDSLAVKLAAYVPRQLPVFLDAIDLTDYRSGRLNFEALNAGIQAEQKPFIFSALRANPALANIVLQRGWTEEARAHLIPLTRLPERLDDSVFKALVWLEAPEIYPRLLEDLRTNPSLQKYEVLRTLPGIERELDETVRRMWRESRIEASQPSYSGGALSVALRHGNRDALETALRTMKLMSTLKGASTWGLLESLRENVAMPELKPDQRYQFNRVEKLLAGRTADQFRFDPVRRRFVTSGS